MAVPPIQPLHPPLDVVRAPAVALVVDLLVGLLIVVTLPLAILAIPNTISVVAALLPPDVSQIAMMRAHGLALPAMLLTVPAAALAVRRFRAAPVLVAGLTVLALADAAGGFAGGPAAVAVLRVLHGIGAGLLVPATLVAAMERRSRRVLLPVWAGSLAVSLLAAQALALWPLDAVSSWQVTLQPYPLLTGVALALAAVFLVLWMVSERDETAGTRLSPSERTRLIMAAVPSAGIALLAVGTTFDWPPVMVIAVASVAVVAMLGLGSVATFEGPGGRALAFTNVGIGLVVLPTAAQLTYVELGGLGGPGLTGMWAPFGVAVLAALLAAYAAMRVNEELAARLTAAGLVTVVVGLCAVRLLVPTMGGSLLVVPFVLLATGAAVALVSALRLAGQVAALFGLSLLFPAVLAGFLLGTGIQVTRLRAVSQSGNATRQAMVDGFVGALHLWALIGGFVVVVVLLLASFLARRSATATDVPEVGQPVPVVPAPTPSPEDTEDMTEDAADEPGADR
ncbi:hypothetical protein Acor_32060 [Acrocarpospora corrugata]|uniref:MFS transporter n=1 Tax=Acrocarpospora corrugata TaxID=35763 RepID=A0A5M3VZG2_9ACTN|nr:hypothetical protein [Acrocarpospora corrugata]GES01142.1 hypothetical protein Acor_32060 [Acrocarpospora corrugata]